MLVWGGIGATAAATAAAAHSQTHSQRMHSRFGASGEADGQNDAVAARGPLKATWRHKGGVAGMTSLAPADYMYWTGRGNNASAE